MNDPLDRSDMIEAMRAALEIDPSRTAVVGVDLHRGHLDHEVATFPLPAERAASVGVHLGFRDHAKAGAPVTLISMIFGAAWLWGLGAIQF